MEGKNLKEVKIPEISTSAESTLTTIGGIILFLGIISTLILACTTLQTKVYNGYYHVEQFNPMGLALTLGSLLSSLATWAVLRVIANISLRLKAIQETMPRRLMTEAEIKAVKITGSKAEVKKFTVGDTIFYNEKKYHIVAINEDAGKICINKGFFAGYAWLYPGEVSKVEE